MVDGGREESYSDPVPAGPAQDIYAGHPPGVIVVVEQTTDGPIAGHAGKCSPWHDTCPRDRAFVVVGE